MSWNTKYPREKTQKEIGSDAFSSVSYTRWLKGKKPALLSEPIMN